MLPHKKTTVVTPNKRTKPEKSSFYYQLKCCFQNNVDVFADKSRLGGAESIIASCICRAWPGSSPKWPSFGAGRDRSVMPPDHTYCKLCSLLKEALKTCYNGFVLL